MGKQVKSYDMYALCQSGQGLHFKLLFDPEYSLDCDYGMDRVNVHNLSLLKGVSNDPT